MTTDQLKPRKTALLLEALREARSKGHRNLSRRRLRMVAIERHHLAER